MGYKDSLWVVRGSLRLESGQAMADDKFIRTRFEWLDVLAAKSKTIARLDLTRAVSDEAYRTKGQKLCENRDAFNFSNSEPHNDFIAQTIEQLAAQGVLVETIRKLVLDLTSRNTYGTICELGAYAFLLEGNHDFDIQAHLTGAEILNPNGSDLDGVIRLPEEIFFDVKSFGFHQHLMARLVERLSEEFAPGDVVAEESWDVPVSLLFDLLSRDYKALRDELKSNRTARRGVIRFTFRAPAKFRVSNRVENLGQLAAANAEYAFNYAKQFVRSRPFFLIFVTHPWMSFLHENWTGSADAFTRAFAKDTFTKFKTDNRPMFDVTMAEASSLLSGIIFVNAWVGEPAADAPRYRCFLNPFAKNKPTPASMQAFALPYGADMTMVEVSAGNT